MRGVIGDLLNVTSLRKSIYYFVSSVILWYSVFAILWYYLKKSANVILFYCIIYKDNLPTIKKNNLLAADTADRYAGCVARNPIHI